MRATPCRPIAKGNDVYAIALKWPGAELVLSAPKLTRTSQVTLLGSPAPLKWRVEGGHVRITMPGRPRDSAAYVLKLMQAP